MNKSYFLPKILAIAVIAAIYGFVKPTTLAVTEKNEMIKQFSFDRTKLHVPDGEKVFVQKVHPQYEKISTWISSVGASSAFFDFTNSGLFDDLAYIDPRFNKLMITSVADKSPYLPFEYKVKDLYLDETMIFSGVLSHDFNEDGKQDLLVLFLGRSPMILYRTLDGFREVELLAERTKWNSTTGTIADFDGDGHMDVLIGNYFPDWSSLYDANSKDNNQTMQHGMSNASNGAKNRFLLWQGTENGNAIFVEDKDALSGLTNQDDWTLAVAACDINGDLLPELYVANDFGPDKLLLNKSEKGKVRFVQLFGKRHFTTLKSAALGHDSFKGMGAEFYDMNNDGFFDIYISNIADEFALQESHFVFVHDKDNEKMKKGIAPYENRSESLGLSRSSWGWDSRFADFNNDGIPEAIQATGFVKGKVNRWPQLQEAATLNDELLSNPKFWPVLQPGDDLSGDAHIPFFVKSKSGRYFDLAKEIGMGQNEITRGIGIVDANRDGLLDFVSVNQWEDSHFNLNRSKNQNDFLAVSLRLNFQEGNERIISNEGLINKSMPAIGAIARLKFKDGTEMIRVVDGGNGHSSRNSPEIHFGLGKSGTQNELYAVDFSWRDSKGQKRNAKMDLTKGWHTLYLNY
ncbi:hypothetical protein QE382_004377 [Sphingobacterium zeae]|uniref:ASPIC/UnbV domain-containing protein n=1 Tax=Sphingobacterium zeae TaxID=1776859 RepID=A0ABU0UC00_9SPHI|nr:CRTAC1 family protein [Sphingobacterium zeae]MDQ1152393.1 hypothetical protein [Sphingobacterium zeae]